MLRTASLFPLLALTACASTQAAAPARPRPPPVASGEIVAREPPHAAPSSDAIAVPAAVGCEIVDRRVFKSRDEPLSLCFDAGDTCFAHSATHGSRATKVTLTVPRGDVQRTGMLVTLDDGEVIVRGWSPSARVAIAPRVPLTLGAPGGGDFVAPWGAGLEIEEAADGGATVALRLDQEVHAGDGGARGRRRCEDLGLEPPPFDEAAVLRFVAGQEPVAARQGKHEIIKGGLSTPLSITPGGPPVASLQPVSNAGLEIEVLERRGTDTRIFWPRDGYAVFGWVPSTSVMRYDPGAPPWWHRPPGSTVGHGSGSKCVCTDDAPLLVELAGRRVEVGVVRKGASVGRQEHRAGYVVVSLPLSSVELAPEAAWLVREADLARSCAPCPSGS